MNPDTINIILRVVFISSLLHNFLPPWDFLSDFPTAQKYYKLLIYVVGYVALNGRSTIYKSISTNGNGKPNGALPTP